jgi:hypothetical protein
MKSNLPSTIPMLPAGRYWVCDPCFACRDDDWQDFASVIHRKPGIWSCEGHGFFVWEAALGDGLYELVGPKYGTLGVDTGGISIISDHLIKLWRSKTAMRDLEKRGLVASIEMAEDFYVDESNGDATFGEYSVVTSQMCEDEEDLTP